MVIKVNDLSYTYSNADKEAVSALKFTVGRGEIFGFLGPSGAGKTTTQRVLTGLLSDYRGEARVLGQDLREWEQDYYEYIGVSFESPYHYNKLTARENLSYFAALYDRKVTPPEDVLDELDLLDSADQRVENFSKGMKNRLSLARAILHNPEILFLDEPTAGLDPVNSRKVRELILMHRDKGATVFLTTHDMSVAAELCDRVSFIIDGRIEVIDNPHQLELKYGQPLVRVEYRQNTRCKSQEFPLEGIGENMGFIKLLREKTVRSIHTQDATLEDVFIRVTGRSLK
ncbi:MAG TPA: ABC transporter ATP-binding protein [Halanaerobiales bacterium]|nr:ABC transporter ATP-binding protein [Halanaerobiales bacterium]